MVGEAIAGMAYAYLPPHGTLWRESCMRTPTPQPVWRRASSDAMTPLALAKVLAYLIRVRVRAQARARARARVTARARVRARAGARAGARAKARGRVRARAGVRDRVRAKVLAYVLAPDMHSRRSQYILPATRDWGKGHLRIWSWG